MARRLGHGNSQPISRLRFFRPHVDLLEDRLPPGSMLDFFGLSVAGLSMSLRPELSDAPPEKASTFALTRPSAAATTDVASDNASTEHYAYTHERVIQRAQETLPLTNSFNPNSLTPESLFRLGLDNDAADQSMGRGQEMSKPTASLTRSGNTPNLASNLVDDGVFTAPPRGSFPAQNTGILGSSEMITVAAPAAGVVSQTGTDEGGLPRVIRGDNQPDPFQSMVPYSITYNGTRDTPTTGVVKSPAEYDPMRGVIFSYTSYSSIVTDMVKELTEDPTKDDIAYVVVSSTSQQNSATSSFINAGADMSKVQFFIQPSDSVWIRDYGPHFITVDDAPAIVDSHYYPNRPTDNYMPTLLGDTNFKVPTYDMGLYYSGGNFQPGPNGTGFVTSLVNYHNTTTDGYNSDFISELYNKYQGIDTLHVMPQLPFSVDGTGHIDMWMYLVDSDTVIISEFIPGSNSTAIQITNDAVTYMQNLGFNVYRPKAWNSGGTHFTYANAFRVNNRIFVPVYGNAYKSGGNSSYNDEDIDAVTKWQAAAGPGVEIIPIQCSGIIGASGAIHCIVMQVPRYTGSAPAANVVSPTAGEIWLKGTPQTIRWSAMDTNNTDPVAIDIYVSFAGGVGGRKIAADIPDTGSFTWTPIGRETNNAVVKVVAKSGDGDQTTALSQPFTIRTGTKTVYDFSSGAGVNKFGFGSQTAGWANINGNPSPVGTALSAGNYAAMSTSNASGGDTDTNRYIAPVPSPLSNESTHTFNFNLSESISDMDEIEVRWEGYSDYCTHVELYVWDIVAGNWGDGTGLTGNNRYMDDWAGNADGDLVGNIRSDFSRYVDGSGTVRFLIYSDRTGTNPDTQHNAGVGLETFHDYMSVTVKQI